MAQLRVAGWVLKGSSAVNLSAKVAPIRFLKRYNHRLGIKSFADTIVEILFSSGKSIFNSRSNYK
jgi:hypothetical protein